MKKKIKAISKFFYKKFFSSDIEKILNELNDKQKEFKGAKQFNEMRGIDKTLELSENYFKTYKNDPLFLFNHSIILQNYSKDPNKGFKLFENYENIQAEWLEKNHLNNLNEDFIPFQQIAGSLGNHNPLFFYLIYKKIVLKNNLKANVLLDTKSKYTNPSLVRYFKENLQIIQSDDFFEKLNFLYELKKVPLEFTMPFKGTHYPWFATINFIRQELNKLGEDSEDYFFKLNEEDEIKGKKILEKLGLPKSRWFVTLHVRQGKGNELFNSSPKTYLKAIKTIHSNGGCVIRVGDKTMTKLENIEGLIDYPFTKYKSDFMDIYLAAKNEFCIGTSSGYWSLPTFFRKPVLLTNYLPHFDYFMIDEKSNFLPKKIFDKRKNKLISFKEVFSFPLGYMCTNYQLERNFIKDIDNSEDEIDLAVKEMLVIQKKISNPEIENNLIEKNNFFKDKLEENIKDLYKIKLEPFGHLSGAIEE